MRQADEMGWDAWFDIQYDLKERVNRLILDSLEGMADSKKAAIYSALIEGLAEDMRRFINLAMSIPERDADPGPIETEVVGDE